MVVWLYVLKAGNFGYFNVHLPDYLYEAYKSVGGRTGAFTDEDRDLFYKHLTGYDFAAHRDNSAVPVHFRNIKHIKNPLLKLRYVVEVVFPGKAFMISKYLRQRTTDDGQRKSDTSSYHHNLSLPVPIYRKCVGIITSKYWWLWYPYRWWVALRAVVGLWR